MVELSFALSFGHCDATYLRVESNYTYIYIYIVFHMLFTHVWTMAI